MKVKMYIGWMLCLALSGCQLLQPNSEVVPVNDALAIKVGEFDPAAYYLRLNELSEDQIFNELELLNLDPELGNNGIKLGLLYAYKKSPVKNPHRAHAAFNRAVITNNPYAKHGMIVALNDQILDGLRWQHKYEDLGSNQEQQQILLQQQIAALKMQLEELTRIEQQLNERN
ncbi:hypothetical protein [Agarivorans sp. DSG3-1]|uniref:hypothetical protein n=1 Tax=Agarivorans sp. DSG3-1 TaxID=3342249 RepID=UPI00398EBE81